MRRILRLHLLLLLILSACSLAPTNPSFTALTGYWYGEADAPGGGTRRWLYSRADDGTFWVFIKAYRGKRLHNTQKEFGTWGVQEGLLRSRTRLIVDEARASVADTPEGYFEDYYQVLTLTRDRLTVRHLESGNEYTMRRVDERFAREFLDGEEGEEPFGEGIG